MRGKLRTMRLSLGAGQGGKMIIQSELLKPQSIIHGVSTKKYGNMSYDRDQGNQAEINLKKFLGKLDLDLAEISLLKLPTNNTANVALISQPIKKGRIVLQEKDVKEIFRIGAKPGFDACVSKAANTFLAILPADCAPVMLFDPITGYYALVHAGAVGTKDLIVAKTVFCLKKWGRVDARDLRCYVGPNICAKHYKIDGKSYNIASAIKGQLLMTQVQERNIEIDSHCTFEDEHLFFSHYRAAKKEEEGRQIAIIGRK